MSLPRPSSIYPLNSATRSTTNSSIPTATKPSTWKCTLDPTSDLDPITRLTAVSLTTTHQKSTNPLLLDPPFTSKRVFFTDMTLKPYAVAVKISRIYTVGSRSYRDGDASAWVKDDGPAQVLEIACTGYWFEWEGANLSPTSTSKTKTRLSAICTPYR
ncbi:hypothetical protein D6C78_02184 [Aureobasidium pullulans]|uniref:Uncharacterized protein n=1 Tax=Aureobasidium pullulans TaxID=5580 RepID=A0A4T0C0Q6_AURPU|nr:hypothetical protein D6C78_02184 [Aureobasidium pullulans]